ncbi:permease for cytosine/purines, uracil, thiamine, allantoin-domain-containing protein, partial [Rhodotorula diobovata]
DLDPVPKEQRTWSGLDITNYWLSDNFAPATWMLGSSLVALGLTARQAIPLAFVGFTCIGVVISLTGRLGATCHCTFPARSSFGTLGAYAPILVRSILALLWLVILTYQGGGLVVVMLGAIWPSFLNIKNTLPEDLGITTQGMVGFLILWLFQAPLACVPIRKLALFLKIKSVISIVAFVALFIWALVVTKGKGFLLTGTYDEALLPQGSRAWAVIQGINTCAGLYSTVSINIPDFSRFCRQPKSNWTQILSLPISGTIPIAVSILCAAAAEQNYDAVVFDPASLCALFDSRAARFFSAFSFFMATISVNVTANSVSFATDITSVMPRYLTIFRCSALAGLLCWATCPWRIVNNAPSFYNFLGAYPVFLAPVAAIMATDFFLIKKQKVDIREFYNPQGMYRYFYGFNLRALGAWLFAFAPNLPSFAHAVNAANPDVQPYTYHFSWFFSTFTAIFWYWLLNWLFPARATFIDEAVY